MLASCRQMPQNHNRHHTKHETRWFCMKKNGISCDERGAERFNVHLDKGRKLILERARSGKIRLVLGSFCCTPIHFVCLRRRQRASLRFAPHYFCCIMLHEHLHNKPRRKRNSSADFDARFMIFSF
jgi:hypothetical protein